MGALVVGLGLTSRVTSVVGGYLTYGLGVGFGGGLIVTPMYATAAGWFVRRRPLAMAVVATGGRYAPLVVFAALLGVSYGGFVSLGPEAAAVLFGVTGLGAVMGLIFLGSGVGGLIGPPVAGVLADVSDGSALPIALAFVVSLAALGVSLLIPLRAYADPLAGRP